MFLLKASSNRLASALFFMKHVLCWVGSAGRSEMGWVGQNLEVLLMRSYTEY